MLPWQLRCYLYILGAILGACMGSFLNCMAWRLLHGEPISRGRSHCDHCGAALQARDLVPVVSFLICRGQSRCCGAKLSRRHLLAELAGAGIFVSLLFKYGMTLELVFLLILAWVLLAASLTDLEAMVIPDRFILVGLLSGIFKALLVDKSLLQAAGGAAVALVLLLGVVAAEKITKKELMGGGDLKLLLVTGLHFGLGPSFLCLLLACIIGLGFGFWGRKAQEPIPWGPSIALAAWITALAGRELVAAYWRLF